MVNYWVGLSIGFEDAEERQDSIYWWYNSKRDKLEIGDKVIIYQPGSTKENIEIPDRYKFIGNFTIKDLYPDENNLSFDEEIIIWNENEFVDIKSIRNDLEFTSEVMRRHKNMGLVFKNKTWISISKQDYDLIMSMKGE